ncbi:choice-of-anchor tandem repeat GloVer-containing protein [Flavobacterium sp.]|uniref:choice-of-anchor tandem repeat GloVer-containing protein n=1 Tax=Flavobacterium sp. TaxID=239 RepID=UPI004033EDD3
MIKYYFWALLLCFVSLNAQAQQEIWGTVANGGQYGYGYIFRSGADGSDLSIMHHFNGLDGYSPGALLALSNNKLYGVTTSGGTIGTSVDFTYSSGVMYEYDMTTNEFTILREFTATNTDLQGVMPMGDGRRGLTEAAPGIIYSNIRMGNSDRIFSYNIQTNTFASVGVLPEFIGGSGSNTWGMRLAGSLYKAEDGSLYGSTHERSQCPVAIPMTGSIVKVNPLTGSITTPYIAPCASLGQGDRYNSDFVVHDNVLYSTTRQGGTFNNGAIYSYDPASNTYTKKHDFEGGLMGKQSPYMVKGSNGKFYGYAAGGLPQNNLSGGGGILYEFDPATNIFIKKYDFLIESSWFMEVGIYPSSLIAGTNGKLYGTTRNGIFEYDIETGIILPKGRFSIEFGAANDYPSLTAVCRRPSYVNIPLLTVPLCEGSSFSYDLQSNNAGSVTWYHDDVADPSKTGTVLLFDELSQGDAGTWRAKLTNECGSTQTQPMTLIIMVQPEVAILEGTLVTAATGESYQWIDCADNSVIQGATNASFMPQANGNFAVQVTNGECTATSECIAFSTMDNNIPVGSITISLYPNPVGDKLLIYPESGILSGQVINLQGQKVIEITTADTDVSGLAAGIYIASISTEKGVWRIKFVKR